MSTRAVLKPTSRVQVAPDRSTGAGPAASPAKSPSDGNAAAPAAAAPNQLVEDKHEDRTTMDTTTAGSSLHDHVSGVSDAIPDSSALLSARDSTSIVNPVDAYQRRQLAAMQMPKVEPSDSRDEEEKYPAVRIVATSQWRWTSDDDADENLAAAKVADQPEAIATLQAIIDKLAGGLRPTAQQPMKCTREDIPLCLVPVLVALGFEQQGGELRLSGPANPDACERIERWLIRRKWELDVPQEDLVSSIHRLDAKSARTQQEQYELDCLRDRLIDARFEAQIIALSSQPSSASASHSASSSSSSVLGSGASEQFWLVPWSACRINQLELLGRGGQGIVCAGEVELKGLPQSLRIVASHAAGSPQRVRVAFKQLHIPKDADMRDAARARKRFRREIHSTLSFESDFIVQGFGYTVDPATEDLYLILRLYDRGSLHKPRVDLSLKDRLGIAVDAILGVEYLHSNSLVHRDISPANVFLSADPSDGHIRACLGDLGVVRAEGHEGSTRFHTRGYAAPEVARGQYSPQSDIYSLSAVLLELLQPFQPEPRLAPLLLLLTKGKAAVPSHRVDLLKLIHSCVAVERSLPLTAKRALSLATRESISAPAVPALAGRSLWSRLMAYFRPRPSPQPRISDQIALLQDTQLTLEKREKHLEKQLRVLADERTEKQAANDSAGIEHITQRESAIYSQLERIKSQQLAIVRQISDLEIAFGDAEVLKAMAGGQQLLDGLQRPSEQ